MVSPFVKFWRSEPEPDGKELEEAHEIVAFANTPYFPKFIGWLESETDRPMLVGEHTDMILAAARANTLKEIRKTIKQRISQAMQLIESEREDL